jgi:hypothetical protein
MLVRREAARFVLSSHGGTRLRNRTSRALTHVNGLFSEIPDLAIVLLTGVMGLQGLKIAATLFRFGRARF